PMHPEVVQKGPGSCPICGMALEPKVATSDEVANPELEDMTRRLRLAAALTLPVLLLAITEMMPGGSMGGLMTPSAKTWIEAVLAPPVCLWSGWPFYVRAYQSIVTFRLNMFTLIGLGVSAAYLFSVTAALAPGAFPPSFHEASGGVAVYFEAATVIVTLI